MNVNDNAVCLVAAVSLRFRERLAPTGGGDQLFGSNRQVMLLM